MTLVASTLTDTEFRRFCDLVRAKSGMEFAGPRRPDLERAIAQTLTELRLTTPDALYNLLAVDPASRTALDDFIASLTIAETYFFRNRPQFDALEQHILPDLIARRRNVKQLRIWSAGCASGEEPYSLAILLRQLLPDFAAWDISILATDINHKLLQKAERGLYSAWSFRDTPADFQANYFAPIGGLFELTADVRNQVTFAYLNLAEDSYPAPLTRTQDLDLILFRNVLIYFGEEMAQHVIGRLYGALADQGWLLVGHAEPSMTLFQQFTTHNFPGAIVYQKKPADAAASEALLPAAGWAAPIGAGAAVAMTGKPTSRSPRAAAMTPSRTSPQQPARRVARPATVAPSPAALSEADLATQYRAVRDLADQSQLDVALRAVNVLLMHAPLFAPGHYLQGLIFQELDELEGALIALRRCIYVDADFIMGHVALANLYDTLGQAERGRKHRQNAAQLLVGRSVSDPVPEGDGLTVGELLRAVG